MSPALRQQYPGSTQPYENYVIRQKFEIAEYQVSLRPGDVIRFNGVTLEVPGLEPFPYPKFRAILSRRWAVPAYDEDSQLPYVPQRANVQMRPAISGDPMKPQAQRRTPVVEAFDNHQEVATLGNYRQNTNQRNATARAARFNGPKYAGGNRQDTVGDAMYATARHERWLQTPAKITTNVIRDSGAAIAEAKSVQIEPGEMGMTRDELIENLPPEEREIYEQEIASRAAAHAGYERGRQQQQQVLRRPQLRQAHQQQPFNNPPSYRSPDGSSVSVLGRVPQRHGHEVEGIRFAPTGLEPQGPAFELLEEDQVAFEQAPLDIAKPAPAVPRVAPVGISKESENVRRRIALQICPDFPANYDFDALPRKKIARLQADFEDRSDILTAVFAAESDEMKQRLLEEFPDVLSRA